MRVGIKYCGGCNNKYDRVDFVEKIKESLPEAEFVYAKETEVYDFVLFIQGCDVACASKNYQSRHGYFDVVPSKLSSAIMEIKNSVPK